MLQAGGYGIRIDLMPDPRIQHFLGWIPIRIQRFWWPKMKNWKKFTAEKKFIFFYLKLQPRPP
jgi:hypothetical protein